MIAILTLTFKILKIFTIFMFIFWVLLIQISGVLLLTIFCSLVIFYIFIWLNLKTNEGWLHRYFLSKTNWKNMLFYSNMIKTVADFELVPNSCLEKTYPLVADITPRCSEATVMKPSHTVNRQYMKQVPNLF